MGLLHRYLCGGCRERVDLIGGCVKVRNYPSADSCHMQIYEKVRSHILIRILHIFAIFRSSRYIVHSSGSQTAGLNFERPAHVWREDGGGWEWGRTVPKTSVADPDHFDTDPDPTPEKPGCGSGSGFGSWIRIRSCSIQNFVTGYFCLKIAHKTYLLY
jgi:hypothetical protein